MEFVPKSGWNKAEWDYNGALKKGKVSRLGRFTNAEGLSLAFYSWEVPDPKGVVVFSHGHGVRDVRAPEQRQGTGYQDSVQGDVGGGVQQGWVQRVRDGPSRTRPVRLRERQAVLLRADR